MAIHLIAVALTTQNPLMSNGLATMQRHKEKKQNNVGHGDSKCYRSITADIDSFYLLIACEVFATASNIAHIGNPYLMFRVTIIFLKPNRPENV